MANRKAVGIYDRPHPLRRRTVWLPVAIALTALVFWVLFFLIW
jgi:hypothetical protein